MYKYQFGLRKGYSTKQAVLQITDSGRLWIKNWSPAVFFLTFQRHLTQLTMIFCYQNLIGMVYVEILSDGLKTTYTIKIRLSKLVTPYLAVRPISVVYLKDQLWVHCYFCLISFRIFADDTNMFYTSNNLHNLQNLSQ